MTNSADVGAAAQSADPINMEIKTLLVRRGLSQADLATALGLSQPQVSQRLIGRVTWRLDELRAASDVLDVPLGRLVDAHLATTTP